MKDAEVIPKGQYCYTFLGSNDFGGGYRIKKCPYWSINTDYDRHNNGYCSYLEKGDWEDESFGLLWDQCKECGINWEYEDKDNDEK
jgi:hypothetical protein